MLGKGDNAQRKEKGKKTSDAYSLVVKSRVFLTSSRYVICERPRTEERKRKVCDERDVIVDSPVFSRRLPPLGRKPTPVALAGVKL